MGESIIVIVENVNVFFLLIKNVFETFLSAEIRKLKVMHFFSHWIKSENCDAASRAEDVENDWFLYATLKARERVHCQEKKKLSTDVLNLSKRWNYNNNL